MTQSELDAFLTVAQSGSLTAAAERLFITQPALSRRLRTLEEELGCALVRRGRGIRAAELTDQGRAFVPLAEQYAALWRQAQGLGRAERQVLRISSVGSVSSYLLPEVFTSFMAEAPACSLEFHHHHSREAYDYVARGEVDLALISDDRFSRDVQTVPLFREEMLLALSPGDAYGDVSSPAELDPADEIRLPWNPEYDLWHDFWFSPAAAPRVLLDQMSLLEYFLGQRDLWALLPRSAAERMKRAVPGVRIRALPDGPPERFIYYLVRSARMPPAAERFLSLLDGALAREPGITRLL